eukprot:1160804-Pelagomonas_calceolata.AAC.12
MVEGGKIKFQRQEIGLTDAPSLDVWMALGLAFHVQRPEVASGARLARHSSESNTLLLAVSINQGQCQSKGW